MHYVIFALIGLGSLLVGSFGFCQIVGTLKYFNSFPAKSAVITIVIWLAILGGAYWLAFAFLGEYIWAVNVGYAISFLLSLNTKPDNEPTANNTVDTFEETYKNHPNGAKIKEIDDKIMDLHHSYKKALAILDEWSRDDVIEAYNEKALTAEEKEQYLYHIETAEALVVVLPDTLQELQNQRNALLYVEDDN